MKLPQASGREVIKALSKAGFIVDRQRGSHVRLIKVEGAEVRKITVPVHSNRPLKPGTLLRIIKDAELTKEQFYELL
ncbi:MAG: type II toxin-antitoxin system HicA family toxin [Methanobacteriota archaeon]